MRHETRCEFRVLAWKLLLFFGKQIGENCLRSLKFPTNFLIIICMFRTYTNFELNIFGEKFKISRMFNSLTGASHRRTRGERIYRENFIICLTLIDGNSIFRFSTPLNFPTEENCLFFASFRMKYE